MICRYPEATSLEDLLVDLRLGLEELKPSLVVLDSISSIEHASSEKGFRQFMIGVASILREHGRSALITQTIAGLGDDGAQRAVPVDHRRRDPDARLLPPTATSSIGRCASSRCADRRTRRIPIALDIESGGLKVTKLTKEQADETEVAARHRRANS